MNKYQQLMKALIKLLAICFAVVAAFTAVYFVTDDMLSTSETEKNDADAALTRDRGEIANLTNELEKSGLAEKRFNETQQGRGTLDYSANTDALKDWLRQAKNKYRLSNNLKLSLTSEKLSDNKELGGQNYSVFEHPEMKLDFNAISDMHIYSFLEEMTRNTPGLMRIDSITMKRIGDLDQNQLNQIRNGAAPYLIETHVQFQWITLKDKRSKPTTAEAAKP